MGYRIGQYTKPFCTKSPDKKHHIEWNYQPEFEEDVVHINGECIHCNLEFQKTYQQTKGLVAIAKASRTVFDFDQEVVEVN